MHPTTSKRGVDDEMPPFSAGSSTVERRLPGLSIASAAEESKCVCEEFKIVKAAAKFCLREIVCLFAPPCHPKAAELSRYPALSAHVDSI